MNRADFMRELGLTADDVRPPADTQAQDSRPSAKDSGFSERARLPPRKQQVPSRAAGMNDSAELRDSPPPPPLPGRSSYQSQPTAPAPVSRNRAEFLREMGIEEPKEERAAPTTMKATPTASSASAGIGASNRSGQARADFLRSLGIDNMDDPAVAPKAQSNAPSSGPARAPPHETPQGIGLCPHEARDVTIDLRKPAKYEFMQTSSPKAPIPQMDAETENLSAEELKTTGNHSFEKGDFRKAIRLYTRAIQKDTTNAALYSNRSAAYLQGGKQMGIDTRSMALRDAEKAIELKPTWFKGYSRRGDALYKLERYHEAAAAYEEGLKHDPENTNLLRAMGQARDAAGGIKRTELEQSEISSGKSAYDLLAEFRRKAGPAVAGHEYRTKELERFRSTSSLRSESSMSRGAEEVSATAPKLDRSQISEEFSSTAASAYQQTLLESFRRKKASKGQTM